jgi:hypothetical protein
MMTQAGLGTGCLFPTGIIHQRVSEATSGQRHFPSCYVQLNEGVVLAEMQIFGRE